MTEYLLNLLISLICQMLIMSIIRFFLIVERRCIIEVGYHSREPKNKKAAMKLNFLNKLLNWSLCLDAKFNRKTVWIYFACNIFLVMAALGSVILSCVVIFFYNAKEVLLIHLEYFVAIVFIWAIAHYFIDLFFLPSERKRYGISTQKNKK